MSTLQAIPDIVVEAKKPDDFFGFKREVLVPYLPFADAKEFLKPEVTADEWKPYDLTRENVLAEMKEYMAFAIGKALDHRGISAGRSTDKMEAWIWLLGDDPIDAGYANYGAPILRAICERYEWDWWAMATAENGLEAFERMSEGKRCSPDCEEGCGRS